VKWDILSNASMVRKSRNTRKTILEIRKLSESLRKFPPGSSLLRTVTKDYQVPDSKVILKKGMTMLASIYAIHHDPEIYPDPEVFDPDRFSHENMAKRHPLSFIPFGEGPRNCIGMRYYQSKLKTSLNV
jgi:cytochrome P450 family 6